MKAIWLCEDEQARWFEFEEPFDMPDAVTVTKMVPERGPLTDEEIWDEVKAADLDWQTGWSLDEDASNRYITFARAIEAKLREKNA